MASDTDGNSLIEEVGGGSAGDGAAQQACSLTDGGCAATAGDEGASSVDGFASRNRVISIVLYMAREIFDLLVSLLKRLFGFDDAQVTSLISQRI